jgi:hypothetical protein
MPPIVIPGAAQLRVIWQLAGVDWAINVFGVANPTPVVINQALADALGTAIKGYFTSSGINGHINSGVQLNRIGIRDVSVASMLEYFDSGAGVNSGTPGDTLPLQTCLCVTLRTAMAGRSYRGRVYLPAFVESDNLAGGTIDTPARTAATAFVNGIGSALTSHGLSLAVLSRVHSVATPVTTVQSRNNQWMVQRRRRTAH